MKKVFYLFLFSLCAFSFITISVSAAGKFFKQTSSSNMFDVKYGNNWWIDYSKIGVVDNRVVIDSYVWYEERKETDTGGFDYKEYSEGYYNVFDFNGKEVLKNKFKDYSDYYSYDLRDASYFLGDYYYYFFYSSDPNIDELEIVRMNKEMKVVSTIKVPYSSDSPLIADFVLGDDKNLYLLLQDYDYESKEDICFINRISSDMKDVITLECNDENMNKYFEDYNFRIKENVSVGSYARKGNELAKIESGNLVYYVDGKKVFEIDELENDKYVYFQNVKFLDDLILTMDYTMYNESTKMNYSAILAYDKKGNLVHTINENSIIEDFYVDEDTNQLFISSIYFDGFCMQDFYWGEFGDDCNANLEYSVYKYANHNEVLGEDNEIVEKPLPNPDTKDIGIITFILLFFGTLYFYIKAYKERKEY